MKKFCYKVNSLWCVCNFIQCTNIVILTKSKRNLLLDKLKKRKGKLVIQKKIVDKLRRTYEFRISCIQLQLPRIMLLPASVLLFLLYKPYFELFAFFTIFLFITCCVLLRKTKTCHAIIRYTNYTLRSVAPLLSTSFPTARHIVIQPVKEYLSSRNITIYNLQFS